MPEQPDFCKPIVLTIKTQPATSEDACRRLRRLLKAMLRGYGFRCLKVETEGENQ